MVMLKEYSPVLRSSRYKEVKRAETAPEAAERDVFTAARAATPPVLDVAVSNKAEPGLKPYPEDKSV
jgi:hypothetical protein